MSRKSKNIKKTGGKKERQKKYVPPLIREYDLPKKSGESRKDSSAFQIPFLAGISEIATLSHDIGWTLRA
jgi:hypothetical protein